MAADNRNPITFYTADTPNGLKVGIYLHEAGLAHQRHPVDLGAGEQKRPEYLKINPNGKIPAIVDHEAGLTVFESGAILSYLSNKTGHLQPDTLAGQLAVQQWLHFQIGGIGPMLGQLWWFLHGSKSGNEGDRALPQGVAAPAGRGGPTAGRIAPSGHAGLLDRGHRRLFLAEIG